MFSLISSTKYRLAQTSILCSFHSAQSSAICWIATSLSMIRKLKTSTGFSKDLVADCPSNKESRHMWGSMNFFPMSTLECWPKVCCPHQLSSSGKNSTPSISQMKKSLIHWYSLICVMKKSKTERPHNKSIHPTARALSSESGSASGSESGEKGWSAYYRAATEFGRWKTPAFLYLKWLWLEPIV